MLRQYTNSVNRLTGLTLSVETIQQIMAEVYTTDMFYRRVDELMEEYMDAVAQKKANVLSLDWKWPKREGYNLNG